MNAKTIWIIIGLIVLLYIAGKPIGQTIAATGKLLVTIGDTIASLGVKFHG
jgi:hypothetical protein